jgi:beta-glucan synthesis-associated protein KRE6
MSPQFGAIDFDHLTFPTTMRIDYIRVYQNKDQINYGCDPSGFPTEAYINRSVRYLLVEMYSWLIYLLRSYPEAYANPNLTTWDVDYGQPVPKNRLVDQC